MSGGDRREDIFHDGVDHGSGIRREAAENQAGGIVVKALKGSGWTEAELKRRQHQLVTALDLNPNTGNADATEADTEITPGSAPDSGADETCENPGQN